MAVRKEKGECNMTKDEALDLALEALEPMQNSRDDTAIERAITAIKQARALDKKAENARELGLDYEPDYKVTVVDDQHPNGVPLEQWGSPAPVREPVAKHYMDGGHLVYPAAQRQWTGLREAVEAEREACAKVCEDAPEPDGRDLAERIRNRGNT